MTTPITEPEVQVKEVASVEQRARELGLKSLQNFCLLPQQFFTAEEVSDLRYMSHALDLKALYREAGFPVNMVEVDGRSIPFIEDRDNTWVAPAIFIGGSLLAGNPNLVGVALNVLSNYIYDLFRGNIGKKVRVSLVVENKGKAVQYTYEGPAENMPNVEAAVKKAIKNASK